MSRLRHHKCFIQIFKEFDIIVKALHIGNCILKDFRNYFIHRPQRPTLLRYDSELERKDFSARILQRLDIDVGEYSILNVHKIGIEVPGRYVFEELMKWNDQSDYWPNAVARIKRISGDLDHIEIYLFGLEKLFASDRLNFKGISLPSLFFLKKLRFIQTPHTSDVDNARSLLYACDGGYPIGIFSFYVRSSIAELNETEKTQLFSMVAFNFYGKKTWSYTHIINHIWELIHNRVTANILYRIKTTVEDKFKQEITQLERA